MAYGWQCCCDHTCYPCTCGTFYAPWDGSDQTPDSLLIQLTPMYGNSACEFPSGQSSFVSNSITNNIVTYYPGYSAGDVVCPSGQIHSKFSFDTERNSTDQLKNYCGSGAYVQFTIPNPHGSGFLVQTPGFGPQHCFGESGLHTNTKVDWTFQPIPDGNVRFDQFGAFQGTLWDTYFASGNFFAGVCFPEWTFCSLDPCTGSGGEHTCIEVPYCPTHYKVSWMYPSGYSPGNWYYLLSCPSGDCPQGFNPDGNGCVEGVPSYVYYNVTAPYSECQTDFTPRPSGLGSVNNVGSEEGWLVMQNLEYDDATMRWFQYSSQIGKPLELGFDVFFAFPPESYVVLSPDEFTEQGACWKGTLYNTECQFQSVAICEGSNDFSLDSKPGDVGGYVSFTVACCPETCECWEYCQPTVWPDTDAGLNVNWIVTYFLDPFSTGHPTAFTADLSFHATLPIDKRFSCPPVNNLCDQFDGVTYEGTCQTVAIDVNVIYYISNTCEGNFVAGVVPLPIQSILIGNGPPEWGSFGPGGEPYIASSQVCNFEFGAASVQAGAYTWSCTDLMNLFTGEPVEHNYACFDCVTNTFLGYAQNIHDCAGTVIGPCTNRCWSQLGGFKAGNWAGSGVIDLCKGIVSITVFQLGGIGGPVAVGSFDL